MLAGAKRSITEGTMNTGFLLLIVCGAAGGWLFDVLRIPGGSMLGAVLGSMAAKLSGLSDMPTTFNS